VRISVVKPTQVELLGRPPFKFVRATLLKTPDTGRMLSISSKSAVLGTSPRVSLSSGRQQYSSASNGRRILPPVKAFAYSYAESCGPHFKETYERILRYPDGRERRIRYPVPSEDGCNVNASLDSSGTVEEWETHNAYKAARGGLTATTSPVVTPVNPQEPDLPPPPSEQDKTLEPVTAASTTAPSAPVTFPDSPLALLRYLNSDAHRESQRKEWEEVQNSYEILQGCPWPVPRPVYVLAARQPGNEAGLTHTLRTRLPLSDVEDELTKLLRGPTHVDSTGKKKKPLISCSELVDGIVTFEAEDDAERYGQLLEESGTADSVAVARCDSHELFRDVQGVQGAVVLLRRTGGKVPLPHQLASALRGGGISNHQPGLASTDEDS